MNVTSTESALSRTIQADLRNFVAIADYRKLEPQILAGELCSRSQPHYFMAEMLNHKIKNWNGSTDIDARMKTVWNDFFRELKAKNHAQISERLGSLREACALKNPGKVGYLAFTGLDVISRDLTACANEISEDEIEPLFKLIDKFIGIITIRAASKSDDFPTLVFDDILMIASRKEGRQLIRSIISLIEQIDLQGIPFNPKNWIQIQEAEQCSFLFGNSVPITFAINHRRHSVRFPCNVMGGKLTLHIPFRFMGMAHELKHLENYLKDRLKFFENLQTAPTEHLLNSNLEEENVIESWDRPFAVAFGMPPRVYHWGGIKNTESHETNFFCAAQAGLSEDLRRFKDRFASPFVKQVFTNLQTQQIPPESLEVIHQMFIRESPNGYWISPFHTPYQERTEKKEQDSSSSSSSTPAPQDPVRKLTFDSPSTK